MVILVAIIFTMTRDAAPNRVESYSELVDLFKNEKVQSFVTEGSDIILKVRTGDPV